MDMNKSNPEMSKTFNAIVSPKTMEDYEASMGEAELRMCPEGRDLLAMMKRTDRTNRRMAGIAFDMGHAMAR